MQNLLNYAAAHGEQCWSRAEHELSKAQHGSTEDSTLYTVAMPSQLVHAVASLKEFRAIPTHHAHSPHALNVFVYSGVHLEHSAWGHVVEFAQLARGSIKPVLQTPYGVKDMVQTSAGQRRGGRA